MFSKVTAKFYLHLAPKFVNDPMKGVEDHLNRMLLKFNKDIGGVIMSYTNVQLLTDRATILFDSPFMHFHIACDLVVFAPAVGSRIRGVINKQSQTHIGLLVFNLFNVSIGNSDIPSDQFVFQADAGAGDDQQDEAAQVADGRHDNRFRKARHANALTGNWVHTPTQTTLSVGTDLEFVVTEVVRSHDFINIKGSLSGIEFSAQTPAPSPASFSNSTAKKNPKLVVFGDDDDNSAPIPPPAAAPVAPVAKSEKRKRKRDSEPVAESADSTPSVAVAEVQEDEGEAESKRQARRAASGRVKSRVKRRPWMGRRQPRSGRRAVIEGSTQSHVRSCELLYILHH
ncbi:hypothetical protein BCR44DRAFT_1006045 [Catenaria anguillulae PL171]|uniref:RPA43 OB domain-containing protein n=1 Tax=Catenaria anguillulae PL171 TaxID=765915 RepID=A0A1Y2I3I3_9FUNG|nr:hypothetical protein BCR44DRAFT_1006045 [Catenaria anguillulae PL171]